MVNFVKPCYPLLFVFFLSLLQSILTTQEGEALVKWKNSLAPSSFLDSWSLTNLDNLCNWTGITCNSAGSVSKINLFEKQLDGMLFEFGFTSFPNLNNLTLANNFFSGPIPSAIENLTQLQYLYLTYSSESISLEHVDLAQDEGHKCASSDAAMVPLQLLIYIVKQ